MKPPPRTRSKPNRNLNPEPPAPSGRVSRRWQRKEHTSLLNALKRHSRTSQGKQDIDYDYLKKSVPGRSISEIQTLVELLKNKVISLASSKLKKKRWEEKKSRKPIEVWADMASAIAGTQEQSISSAFSQMLTVSSTEPCTLRNCDPPQVHRPPTDKNMPVGRTVPFRPMPRFPIKVELPDTNTARPVMVGKAPAPNVGPAKRLPAPLQVIRVAISKSSSSHPTTAGTSPAATSCQPRAEQILVAPSISLQTVTLGIQTTQQPTPISINSSSVPHTSLTSSTTIQTPVPSTAPPSGVSTPSPTLSTPATEFHAKFGRTSKYATKDSPRMFGVKSVVNFERIYRYLTVIQQPNEECKLTPMESAIVLDLLMSLPEELPLLDCNKLHKHLIQVYRLLSTTADSKAAGEMFKELKHGLCAQIEAGSDGDGNRTSSQQNSAGTADSSGVSEGKTPQPDEAASQSSGNNNTSGQSGDTDPMGHCPPLNPFMVPLKLLMRK